MIYYRFLFTLGTTSSVGTLPTFSLPAAIHADYTTDNPIGIADLIDSGVGAYGGIVVWAAGGVALPIRIGGSGSSNVGVTATAPFTWGTGDSIACTGCYEASS